MARKILRYAWDLINYACVWWKCRRIIYKAVCVDKSRKNMQILFFLHCLKNGAKNTAHKKLIAQKQIFVYFLLLFLCLILWYVVLSRLLPVFRPKGLFWIFIRRVSFRLFCGFGQKSPVFAYALSKNTAIFTEKAYFRLFRPHFIIFTYSLSPNDPLLTSSLFTLTYHLISSCVHFLFVKTRCKTCKHRNPRYFRWFARRVRLCFTVTAKADL